MCKNSIWDLINSDMNKRDKRDVQMGCTGCLFEKQFKAGFVKKFKLKDGSVPIVLDPDALPEVVSLTLYSIYIFL